jgi:dipeptidyl aminopeptidase/acylaminoacyl peptidase
MTIAALLFATALLGAGCAAPARVTSTEPLPVEPISNDPGNDTTETARDASPTALAAATRSDLGPALPRGDVIAVGGWLVVSERRWDGTPTSGENQTAANRDRLWVASADGGDVRLVGEWQAISRPVAAPTGDRIALVTTDGMFEAGLSLHVVDLTSLQAQTIDLIEQIFDCTPCSEESLDEQPARYQASDAIIGSPPVWSPDGRSLAFAAAIHTERAELYVLASESGAVRRVWSPSGQAYRPRWSPDGRRLLVQDVSIPVMGSAELQGAFVVDVATGLAHALPAVADPVAIFDWLDDKRIVADVMTPAGCAHRDLQVVSAEDGRELRRAGLDVNGDIAIDPEGRVALLSSWGTDLSCDITPAGLYRFELSGTGGPQRILSFASSVEWSDELESFVVHDSRPSAATGRDSDDAWFRVPVDGAIALLSSEPGTEAGSASGK